MADAIVLIVDDLMFLPKLENSLRKLGYRALEATDESQLTRALFQSPVLVIVDLFGRAYDWAMLINLIKKSKVGPVPVLGFGPHVDLALREKALAAGCDVVVGRGAISENLAHLIEKHKSVFDKTRCLETPPVLLLKGIELFNEKQYFECHEVIEEAWIEEADPVRIMYQGILQVGVACYHIENKNWRGAMKVLDRGTSKLRRFEPTCMGIDLAKLLRDAETVRHELMRLGPDWQGEFNPEAFPTITIGDLSPGQDSE
jgi:hypothetical protein